MKTTLLFGLLLWLPLAPLGAQMISGQDTLYGNEWIDYDKDYYRIEVAEDGLYRVPQEVLSSAGIDVAGTAGSRYQLWRMGQEVPLYVSSAGPLQPGDYLEFYGQKNRSELDRFLFEDPETMLNPWYSLYTDTMAYYLTVLPPGEAGLRYEEVEHELVDLPGVEEWFWGEERVVFEGELGKRKIRVPNGNNSTEVNFSRYEFDGFSSGFRQSLSFDIPISNLYEFGPEANLELRLVSSANLPSVGHALQIEIEGESVVQEEFLGSEFRKFNFNFPTASLENNLSLSVAGLNNQGGHNADRYAVGGAVLRFPRTYDLSGVSFAKIDLPVATGARYLEIQNLETGDAGILYDVNESARYELVLENNLWKVKLKPAEEERKLILATSFLPVNNIEKINFNDFSNLDGDYLIVTHGFLRSDGGGQDWVQAYAAYRASEKGGGFNTVMLNIQELYDQFTYGIYRHPLAVRNAVHFLMKEWDALDFCFLIGKGQNYGTVRSGAALTEAIEQHRLLIPGFGTPASDNLLMAWPGKRTASLAHGRIAATRPEDVKVYLEKVQAVEAQRDNPQTIEDRAWMKRIIHLGGGNAPSERDFIRSRLEAMGQIAESGKIAASVNGFYKGSTSPLEASLTEQVFREINQGSILMTFFGHSSPGNFDFNIDDPDNYNNGGRCPIFLSFGCYSGNFFTSGRSIGERFTFQEGGGALGFGATIGLGYISSLSQLGSSIYLNLGDAYYGEEMGEVLLASLKEYEQSSAVQNILMVEQFAFHGDPALKLPYSSGPDYIFDASSAVFHPELASTVDDSVHLSIDILNIGRNHADTFQVALEIESPNGSRRVIPSQVVEAGAFRTTHTFSIPIAGEEMAGLNTLYLTLDSENDVAEYPAAAENNNTLIRTNGSLGIPFLVSDDTAQPIWPPEFGIVGEVPTKLQAFTLVASVPERSYVIEIDTTISFDSAVKRRTTVKKPGGLLSWTPTSLNWMDSTVYYWRISPLPETDTEPYAWIESSFSYIPDSRPGWRQGDYFQYEGNSFHQAELIDSIRNLDFKAQYLEMLMSNRIFGLDDLERPFFSYNNDGPAGSVQPWFELDAGMAAVIGEPRNTGFWRNSGQQYGSVDGSNESTFSFDTRTEAGRTALVDFLREVVPDDHYVFLFSLQNGIEADYAPEDWAHDSISNYPDLFQTLEQEGASMIRQLEETGALPYAILYQKGKGIIDESLASSLEGEANVSFQMPRYFTEGSMSSQVAGPAKSWHSAHFLLDSEEFDSEKDMVRLAVLGLDEKLLLVDTLLTDTLPYASIDLSGINPEEYPFLKLNYWLKDEEQRDMANLVSWSVLYDPVGDYAISENRLQDPIDTIQQGASATFLFDIFNVSAGEDSLLLNCTIQHEATGEALSSSQTIWINDDVKQAGFEFPSAALPEGSYIVDAALNPDSTVAERYHFNNFLSRRFFIVGDQKPPALDVTFNGRRILDEDIVSRNASIAIQLWDDNPYLLLSDTSVLDISFVLPDGTEQRLRFDDPNVQFIAGTTSNNKASVIYQSDFLQSGIYELSIRARDASNNLAGSLDYQRRFKVFTENSISNVLNYPNPFSTSTQFVYTLTGEPPAEFRIQIATVSGRIVKEITQSELGMLEVGTHRTNYRWDGTDEYGDRLANGVYLYRIIAKDAQGKDYRSYSELDSSSSQGNINSYFKNGWGKMVIMR